MSKTIRYNLRQMRDELKAQLPKHEQRRVEASRQARAEWYAWREAMKESRIAPHLWR
jgi:hypothetical protein